LPGVRALDESGPQHRPGDGGPDRHVDGIQRGRAQRGLPGSIQATDGTAAREAVEQRHAEVQDRDRQQLVQNTGTAWSSNRRNNRK
jgi:hypothetical protein